MTASTENIQLYRGESSAKGRQGQLLDIAVVPTRKLLRPQMAQTNIYLSENTAKRDVLVKQSGLGTTGLEAPSIIEIKLNRYGPASSTSHISLERKTSVLPLRKSSAESNRLVENGKHSSSTAKVSKSFGGQDAAAVCAKKTSWPQRDSGFPKVDKSSLQRSYSDVQQYSRPGHTLGHGAPSSSGRFSHLARNKPPGTPQRNASVSSLRNNLAAKTSVNYVDALNVGSKRIHLRDTDKLDLAEYTFTTSLDLIDSNMYIPR